MVTTPLDWACASIALAEPESRLTIIRTPTPSLSIDCACVVCVVAEPLAFWMSQVRPYWSHCVFSSLGSELTHRGEEFVSGRRMPTLLFLYVGVPLLLLLLPEAALVVELPPPVVEVLPLLFELLHPAALNATAAPSAVIASIALRMGACPFLV